MDVLFLRNPDTGEVRRFFARAAVPHDIASFEGWESVDAMAWIDANADPDAVQTAVARYNATAPAHAEPTGDGGVDAENRDGHIFDMALKDGGTARAVWLPETNANMTQLFIEQGHSAQLYRELDSVREQLAAVTAERDAAVALVNKAHKVLQDVERWLPTTENFDLGEKHYSEVHSAWKAGAWIRNYWLHLSEQKQATGGEVAE